MAQSDTAKDPELAARMKLLRLSLGKGSGVEMAAFLGVSPQRWNNVEKGLPLGKSLASIIKRRVPGIDLDWLHEGDPDGLPLHMRVTLAPASMPPPAKATASSRGRR